MTRYARAKGSKASNEKLANEATPWQVMKRQLEESVNKGKPVEEKVKPTRQIVEEFKTIQSVPSSSDWAEFDVPNVDKKDSKLKVAKKIEKKIEKKIKKKKLGEYFEDLGKDDDRLVEDVSSKIKMNKNVTDKTEKLKKTKVKKLSEECTPAPKRKKIHDKTVEATDNTENKIPKKKRHLAPEESAEISVPAGAETSMKLTEKLSKRQKRNLKKKNQNSEVQKKNSNNSVFDTAENNWNSDVKFGNSHNKFEKKSEPFQPAENNFRSEFQNQNNFNQSRFGRFGGQRPNMKNHHLRQPKVKDNAEHQRRKPAKSSKLIINGQEVEIEMYDGFPIQKEDAEELKQLKKQMIFKGIPKSEIDAAMKLRRRKAEKALARIRKQVCFHCRKSGHNLSACPELGMEEAGTGICFKCGSTEHTHFECKVTKSDDYRYATCFICREPGHIAKQCPDNPKGLYPNGGGCKICGDVTHMKKDCQDATREKEDKSITLETITDNALESLEEEKKVESKIGPKKKIVKF